MDDRTAGKFWEANAETWTLLAHEGWDVYRDAVNTPAFFRLLPDVSGQRGLDIGCGEGSNTRALARRGALMWALDIAPTFIRAAECEERLLPLGIRYLAASAHHLPFPAECFDFVTAFMSLMDMPAVESVLLEVRRVLRPGGFFQFSITHPFFDMPRRKQLSDGEGRPVAFEVAGYFEPGGVSVDQWMFSSIPEQRRRGLTPFRVPRFRRPLAAWLNALCAAGFLLERTAEPCADEETARRVPTVADTRLIPYFLHVRCRKP